MIDRDGFLDRRVLRERGRAHRADFLAARPFSHVVLDGFLPRALADALAHAFPPPDHLGWKRRDHAEQSARLGQLQRTNFEGVAPSIRHFLNELNGMAMLDFLAELTGETGLIADPHFHGAGLQCTLVGGHLDLHVDFARDRFRKLARALTVMLYVPVRWDPAWGGALELHGSEADDEVVVIDPLPNRLVVMAHGPSSFHGHPRPLACPPDERRQAIAAYYYVALSADDGDDADVPSGATWRREPV